MKVMKTAKKIFDRYMEAPFESDVLNTKIILLTNGLDVDYEKLDVSAAMKPSFPVIDEETDIDSIKSILNFHKAVLVQKNGKNVGIISRSDLF